MKSSFLNLYIERKSGRHMSFKYKASAVFPALLILLVAFILNYSLIFISSMASGIENILIQLGSGSIRVEGEYREEIGCEKYYTKEATALAFSASSSAPIYLKGVDLDAYFTESRQKLLNIENSERDLNVINPVFLSSRIAKELSVKKGDRFTLMLYDEERGRTRPLLATCAEIFDSGYAEFDSMLSFISLNAIDSSVHTEIILDKEAEDDALSSLLASGYDASSYKEIYRSIYSNVEFSVDILYLVFAILALLASFFSSNISFIYVDRDKKDIALLLLSGLSMRDIKKIYVRITMRAVSLSVLLGLILSFILSFFTPSLLSLLSRADYKALDAYLISFRIIIPYIRIALMNILLLFFSYISLEVALRSIKKIRLIEVLSST